MAIAALITEGIGPQGTIPYVLTEGFDIGLSLSDTHDGGTQVIRESHLRKKLGKHKRNALAPFPAAKVIEVAPLPKAVIAVPIDDTEDIQALLMLLESDNRMIEPIIDAQRSALDRLMEELDKPLIMVRDQQGKIVEIN